MTEPNTPNAVEVLGVEKKYIRKRVELSAVGSVSFEVRAGEFIAIVGPSGCGKSTLLKLIAGLVEPTGGQIFLNGELVQGPAKDVGMVFQTPVLLPWRDVLSNILLYSEILKLDGKKYRDTALRLCKLVGLGGFEHKRPFELSGGMQQRVSLCRALLIDPALLLMDEPFGALDAITRDKMNFELQRIWARTGKTVLLVTHSIPEALFLADRVIVMTQRPGRIKSILVNDIKRPRDISTFETTKFIRNSALIREEIEGEMQDERSREQSEEAKNVIDVAGGS